MSLNALKYATLLTLVFVAQVAFAADEGFKSIFNGKDLTGWDGNMKLWSVKDGAIVGETTKENPTKGNTFLVWKDGKPKDFEFKCMFKLEGGNNSGVQYRSKDHGNFVLGGYQCDLNKGFPQMCKLYEEKGSRGRMAMGGEKVIWGADDKKQLVGPTDEAEKLKSAEKAGDWNECVIIANGNHIIQKLNGVVTVDFTDNHETKRHIEGLLGLQIHAGSPMKISFKDIMIKELPPEAGK